MRAFLRKVFGIAEPRPARGDSRYTYWQDPSSGKYNFHLQDGNNQVICGSNQGYDTEAACLAGIENVREEAFDAVVVRRELA